MGECHLVLFRFKSNCRIKERKSSVELASSEVSFSFKHDLKDVYENLLGFHNLCKGSASTTSVLLLNF